MNTYSDDDSDLEKLDEEFNSMGEFYQDFADKIIIYDPLDRNLPNDEDD